MPLQIRDIRSFHIGGGNAALRGLPPRRMVLTPSAPPHEFPADGDFESGQMYVQAIYLAEPTAPCPLLMWHGGGMTGATWETEPDGGPGWQSWFLHAGWDVYVSDAVERGRSGWSRHPEIYRDPPHFRSKQEAWDLFRFGPPDTYESRVPYPGQLFPVDWFDQFAKQIVPRWTSNDAATQAAYDMLVRHAGPCVVMTHSQGGAFGYTAALHAPALVRAVVAIEPSGAPDPSAQDMAALAKVPHLLVLGDYLNQHAFWPTLLPGVHAWQRAVRDAGGVADTIDLPALGIAGNSHFPMMDRNSDMVAELVQDWLARNVG